MTTMPDIRKNLKFFANGKNEPLVKLATMVQDTEEVLSLLAVETPGEFNTCLQVQRDLYPLLSKDSTDITFDKRYQQRSIMYNRMDIVEALRIEFGKDSDGVYNIDPETYYENPLELQTFIDVLNKKFGYDMTTDDISITHTFLNNYTITARPNSLQYYGQVSVNLGLEDDTPPPVKIPSHDAVWENATLDTTVPTRVNGNLVNLKNYQAMFNAGIAFVQYKQPDMAWVIWTGALQGEATFEADAAGARVANVNVNETLTVTGQNLYGKYVPFTPNPSIPAFENPITAVDFKQNMQFMFPYAPSLDKIVGVWINDTPVLISDLLKTTGSHGFKLTMNTLGESVLTHDGQIQSRVTIRVAVPSLPNLARTNSRFINGILRNGNQIPTDLTGREVYHIDFPAKVIIVPEPSVITAVVPDNQIDYSTSLAKVATGLSLNYTDYRECSPTIQTTQSGRQQLVATVESEDKEARFPSFYFIKQADWNVISTQPVNTVLGTYTAATTPVTSIQVTVGLLLSTTVPVAGGRLLCIVMDIPARYDASFKLNYQPGSEYYKETTTPLRLDVAYNKASLIYPRDLNKNILKDLVINQMTNTDFELMWTRQQEVKRFINQVGEDWYGSYEFAPFSPPDVLTPSADENGLYILQLFSIPGTAMTQIQGIAARKPNAVILKLTDSGGINTTNMTAMQIVQTAVVQAGSGDGYLFFKHSKQANGVQVSWQFKTDYDEVDLTYRETTTNFIITDSVIDNPAIPFSVTYQECDSEEQYDEFVNSVTPTWGLQYFSWDEHKLLINLDSTAGVLTKYGTDTLAKHTVGRLLIPIEAIDWFRNGSYEGMPVEDPTVIKIISVTTDDLFEVKASYIKQFVNSEEGIPVPLPLFDDQGRTLTWTLEVQWFGFGNPLRPVPSPLPNLVNGIVTTSVQNVITPITNLPSLFEFTERQSSQENSVMRSTLIAEGKPITVIDQVVKRYDVYVNQDTDIDGEAIGSQEQHWFTQWDESLNPHPVMQVIAISLTTMNAFKNSIFTEDELDQVVFTFTPSGTTAAYVDRTITVRQIRNRGIISTSEGYIPVVGLIEHVVDFGSPVQETQEWIADYSILNGAGTEYEIRLVNLYTEVYLENSSPAPLRLSGPKDHVFSEDLDALALAQWPAKTLIPIVNQSLTANNNFGIWDVTFLNKGKVGFEALLFSAQALTLIETAFSLAPTVKILTVVISADINNFTQTYSYSAAELKAHLDDSDIFIIPLDAFIVDGGYKYNIGINLNYNGTTSNAGPTLINNVTTIKDVTPTDVEPVVEWTMPSTDEELASWCLAIGLSPITIEQYGLDVTPTHYNHNVTVDYSNVEYVVALVLNKEVRQRLVENQFSTEHIVGSFNGTDLTVGNLTSGIVNANGDNILLVRAPISIGTNNSYTLVLNAEGITNYTQVFTGIDIPVIEASNVIVTKIQNSMGQVIQNLRNALNPIADEIITVADFNAATITEDNSTISNVINSVSRDNIGKSWVIPIGVDKAQLENIKPGSWLIVRAAGTGIDISVDTTQLVQYVSEGWSFVDTDGKDYAIYPLIFKFDDVEGVVKIPFSLAAGMKVGRWAPWFENFERQVNFEYSIRTAEQTFVTIEMPDVELFDALVTAFNLPEGFIPPVKFTSSIDIGTTATNVFNLATQTDTGKYVPIFASFLTAQIEATLADTTLGTIKRISYFKDESGDFVVNTEVTYTFDKAALQAGKVVGEYTYLNIGEIYPDQSLFAQTYHADFDFDGGSGNWLSEQSSFGALIEPAYDVNCTGALNHAGVLDVSETMGTQLVTIDGSTIRVTDDENFIEVLRTTFGLEVVELTPYAPPSLSPDEMYFTTTVGTIKYTGLAGDVITLSDGSVINLEVDSIEALTVPAGKHKVKLNGSRSEGSIGLGGAALVEVHNFPTLETVNKIDFYPNVNSPNLIKVPEVLPSNITDLSAMFYKATTFNQDISGWDVSNVTNMTGMFGEAYAFNQPLNAWNTGHVTNMRAMFINAAAFNQPLNDWNVSAVVNMDSMFYNAYAFNQPLNLWNTSKVTNMDAMFNTTNNFNQDLSQWCVGLIGGEPLYFRSSSRLTEANLPVWGTCPRGENLISE